MQRHPTQPPFSSPNVSQDSSYNSLSNDPNNSTFSSSSFRAASRDSYNDDLQAVERMTSRFSLRPGMEASNSPLPHPSYQLQNMLRNTFGTSRQTAVIPRCESVKESKLRFKAENEFQVIHFQDPSVSRDLSPPPLDRVPPRSCLKQRGFPPIVENAEHGAKGTRVVYQPSSLNTFSIERTVDPVESERETQNNECRSKEDSTVDSTMTEEDNISNNTIDSWQNIEKEKKILEEWNSENRETSDAIIRSPTPIDYWSNTNYRRRSRRNQYIRDIFAVNSKKLMNREFIKEVHSTLILVELCQDYGHHYAKCYVAADLPIKLVVIPLRLFPIEKISPLGSTWRASLELIAIEYSFNRGVRLLRASYNKPIELLGMIKNTIPRRTITFGERGSSFYCEMLQIYAPLKQVLNKEGETLFGYFGNVTFNANVLPRPPKDIVIVEGFGWVEPKPAEMGIISGTGCMDEPWLLVEPFVPSVTRKEFLEDAILAEYERKRAEQKQMDEANERKIAEMLKWREEGYTMHPRTIPVKKHKNPHTPEGRYGKRERREICEKILQNIQSRGTKMSMFNKENIKRVFDLVKNREKRGTRLGQLCLIVLPYIRDEKTFNYLKENEPDTLEDFRLIVKWTVDYSKGRRENLSVKLYNFVFPLAEDPFCEESDWED